MLFRLVLVLALALGSARALAADLPITAFAGKWQGSAVSESNISVNFALTSRDIGVELRPAADGFTITWNTVQRQKGDPTNPTEVLRSTTMRFVDQRPGVWRFADNADPLAAEQPFAWAHVSGKTLTISVLQIYQDGRHELQIYHRTLSDLGMSLEFTRVVEGQPVRRAGGRLVKIAK